MQLFSKRRYLGGFIGDQVSEKEWLSEKVVGCIDLVEVLAGLARQHPQTAYDGLQKSLHQERDFIQSITPHIRETFRLVAARWRKAVAKSFLPALFQGVTVEVPLRGIACLPVKQDGTGDS